MADTSLEWRWLKDGMLFWNNYILINTNDGVTIAQQSIERERKYIDCKKLSSQFKDQQIMRIISQHFLSFNVVNAGTERVTHLVQS